jgi:hypothetical protein
MHLDLCNFVSRGESCRSCLNLNETVYCNKLCFQYSNISSFQNSKCHVLCKNSAISSVKQCPSPSNDNSPAANALFIIFIIIPALLFVLYYYWNCHSPPSHETLPTHETSHRNPSQEIILPSCETESLPTPAEVEVLINHKFYHNGIELTSIGVSSAGNSAVVTVTAFAIDDKI